MADSPFTLDRVPPDVRKARAEAEKATRRAVNRRLRERAVLEGKVQLAVFVPVEIRDSIDEFQKQQNLQNRSEAISEMLKIALGNTKGKKAVSG
jgi:hypothetical protein